MEIASPPAESPFLSDSASPFAVADLASAKSTGLLFSHKGHLGSGDTFTGSQADPTLWLSQQSSSGTEATPLPLKSSPSSPSDSGDVLTGQQTHSLLPDDGDALTQAASQATGKKGKRFRTSKNGETLVGTKDDDRFIVSKGHKRTKLKGRGGDDFFDVANRKNGGRHKLWGHNGNDTFLIAKKTAPKKASTIHGFKPGKDTLFLKKWSAGALVLDQRGKDTLVKSQNNDVIVRLKKVSSDVLSLSDFKGPNLSIDSGEPPLPPPPPSMSISGGTVTERDSGTSNAVFTVTLSKASSEPVTVSYRTIPKSATPADNDYIYKAGTLTFSPGQTSKSIGVAVIGDETLEFNESFNLKLENPQNAVFSQAQAAMTIINDDTETVEGKGNGADGNKTDDVTLNYNFQIYTISKSGQYRVDETINLNTGVDANPSKGVFSGAIEAFTAELDDLNENVTIEYSGLTLDLEARFIAAGETVTLPNGSLENVTEDRLEYVITGEALSNKFVDGQRVTEITLQTTDLDGIDTDKAVNCIDYIVDTGIFTQINDENDDVRIAIEKGNPPTTELSFASDLSSTPQDSPTLERTVVITNPNNIPQPPPVCHGGNAA